MTMNTEYQDRVKGPGKFEGEQPYVPYFWDVMLDGGADQEDGALVGFEITKMDRERFPGLLDDAAYLALEETDQGFVYSQTFTFAEESEYRSLWS